MITKTMTDVAYLVLEKSKSPLKFDKLWTKVCQKMDYDTTIAEKKVAQFYNNMMLDARFVFVRSKWDLRERRKYDEVHIDASEIIIDEEEDEKIDKVSLLDDNYNKESSQDDEY